MRTILFWLGLFVAVTLVGVPLGGCLGGSASPCQGGLRCDCYANSSCNTGLSCRSNVCVVEPDDSGTTTPPPGDDAATSDESFDDAASEPDTQSQPPPDSSGGGNPNVVTNGDFSQGEANWGIVAGNGTFTATGGKGCVAVDATQLNQTVTLGWPEPAGSPGAVLVAGTSYTFSYSAMAMDAPISVDAKVGQTTSPYAADFETATDAVTTQVTPFSHTFTASGDPSAGIAFAFMAGAPETVCFQSVSLVQN